MNDWIHISAAALFAVGLAGIAAHRHGKNRLWPVEGNEARNLALSVYGPVVTTVAWCVAGALEVAARVLS